MHYFDINLYFVIYALVVVHYAKFACNQSITNQSIKHTNLHGINNKIPILFLHQQHIKIIMELI